MSSFWVVGYFYPVLMFLILSLLPMLQFLPRSLPSREWSESGVVLLVGFCALQLFPRLLTSDPALTGEGRQLALNMFDAPISCRAELEFRSRPGQVVPLRVPFLQGRLRCDPIVFRAAANEICRTQRSDIGDLDLRVVSKRSQDPAYTTVVDIHDFCSAPPSYSMFRHNLWIGEPDRKRPE